MQEDTDTRDVISTRPPPWIWVVIAAGLVLTDEIIKWFALGRFPMDTDLTRTTWITLAIHKNVGIAFDIPFARPIVLFLSLVIGFFLLHLLWKHRKDRPELSAACAVTLLGAAGNFFDRVVYGFTVDYLLLFGRSAINISDLVIILGLIGLLWSARRSSQHIHTQAPVDKNVKNV